MTTRSMCTRREFRSMGYPVNIIQSLSSTYCKYTSEFSLNLSSHCNWTPRMESRDMIACKVVPPPQKSCFFRNCKPKISAISTNLANQIHHSYGNSPFLLIFSSQVIHPFTTLAAWPRFVSVKHPRRRMSCCRFPPGQYCITSTCRAKIEGGRPGVGEVVVCFFCGSSHHLRSNVVICCNDIYICTVTMFFVHVNMIFVSQES